MNWYPEGKSLRPHTLRTNIRTQRMIRPATRPSRYICWYQTTRRTLMTTTPTSIIHNSHTQILHQRIHLFIPVFRIPPRVRRLWETVRIRNTNKRIHYTYTSEQKTSSRWLVTTYCPYSTTPPPVSEHRNPSGTAHQSAIA
jgi:hypothetical protein